MGDTDVCGMQLWVSVIQSCDTVVHGTCVLTPYTTVSHRAVRSVSIANALGRVIKLCRVGEYAYNIMQ